MKMKEMKSNKQDLFADMQKSIKTTRKIPCRIKNREYDEEMRMG